MYTNVVESDAGRKLSELLDEHYDTLEKLYSLVLAIQYNLDRRIFTFLRPLNMAKRALLEELNRHRGELEAWLEKLPKEVSAEPKLKKQLQQIQKLGERILQVDAQNLSKAQTVGSRMLDSTEIERSHLCEWRSQI